MEREAGEAEAGEKAAIVGGFEEEEASGVGSDDMSTSHGESAARKVVSGVVGGGEVEEGEVTKCCHTRWASQLQLARTLGGCARVGWEPEDDDREVGRDTEKPGVIWGSRGVWKLERDRTGHDTGALGNRGESSPGTGQRNR